MKMSGEGFRIDQSVRDKLKNEGFPTERMPRIVAGSDVTDPPSNLFAIDCYGLSETELRKRFPGVYQHLFDRVKPERDQNDRASYRENWWLFAEPRPRLRASIAGLRRYIVTSETSKHRIFRFCGPTARSLTARSSPLRPMTHSVQTSRLNHNNEIKGLERKAGVLAPFPAVTCALFFNRLASARLGIVRLPRRRGNSPETPPKRTRKSREGGSGYNQAVVPAGDPPRAPVTGGAGMASLLRHPSLAQAGEISGFV